MKRLVLTNAGEAVLAKAKLLNLAINAVIQGASIKTAGKQYGFTNFHRFVRFETGQEIVKTVCDDFGNLVEVSA